MWRALIWKDYREHRWKMLAAVISFALPLIARRCLFAPSRDTSGLTFLTFEFLSIVMPVWIAAGTVTSEHSCRTSQTLAALPVHEWSTYLSKTIWGMATFLLPMCLLINLFPIDDATKAHPLWTWALLFGVAACYTYLLTLWAAARARHEAVVALIGVLIVIAQIIAVALGVVIAWSGSPHLGFLLSISPLSFIFLGADNSAALYCVLAVYAAVCAILWLLGARRYRRLHFAPEKRISTIGATSNQYRAPTTFRWGSYWWKEWREQRAVVYGTGLVTIALAISIGLLLAFSEPLYNANYSRLNTYVEVSGGLIQIAGIYLPTMVAIVLGINSWARDLEPGVNNFWRSRPIQLKSFFWIKYAVAMTGVLLLTCGLTFFAFAEFLVLGADSFVKSEFLPQSFFAACRTSVERTVWLAVVLTVSALIAVILQRGLYAAMIAIVSVLILAMVGSAFFNAPTLFEFWIFSNSLLTAALTVMTWLILKQKLQTV